VKAALLDQTGAVLEDAQAPLSTTRGPDGRMHQHLDDWQDAVRAVIADCLRGDGSLSAGAMVPTAVSVTGQMQDLVLLDEHGRPTHPVVLYSDTHARSELADLTRANPTWAPGIAVTPPPGPHGAHRIRRVEDRAVLSRRLGRARADGRRRVRSAHRQHDRPLRPADGRLDPAAVAGRHCCGHWRPE
jgi:xylulokinase